MPEGSEIAVISDALQKLIAGYTLHSYSLDPRLKTTNLYNLPCPNVIQSVSSHGKKVVFHLSKGTLISCLGMVGRWCLEPETYTLLTLCLTSPQGKSLSLYYRDHRFFGGMAYSPHPFSEIKHEFGRDLLKDPPSESEWLQTMRSYRRKNICAVLLDTKHYNSIGNYIKSDSLYLAKISPHRTINTLSDEELLALRKAALEVLNLSYKAGGLTIKDFWSLHGEKGLYQAQVYDCKKDRAGRTVVYEKIGGRGTYWVPEVQK